MVESAQRLRLLAETREVAGLFLGLHRREDRLDGDAAPERLVLAAIDDAHRAAPDLGDDAVAADALEGLLVIQGH